VHAVADAYQSESTMLGTVHTEKLSAAVLTSLSAAGIPVVSVIDPVTGLVADQSAAVQNPAVADPRHLFTDSAGRLLPYDDIYAVDPDTNLPENPQRQKDFEDWYGSAGLFGDKLGKATYEDEVASGYQAGIDRANF
jgi:hypothetical protein